eukprot:285246-Chlamydomonas_euryale.AAC.1
MPYDAGGETSPLELSALSTAGRADGLAYSVRVVGHAMCECTCMGGRVSRHCKVGRASMQGRAGEHAVSGGRACRVGRTSMQGRAGEHAGSGWQVRNSHR